MIRQGEGRTSQVGSTRGRAVAQTRASARWRDGWIDHCENRGQKSVRVNQPGLSDCRYKSGLLLPFAPGENPRSRSMTCWSSTHIARNLFVLRVCVPGTNANSRLVLRGTRPCDPLGYGPQNAGVQTGIHRCRGWKSRAVRGFHASMVRAWREGHDLSFVQLPDHCRESEARVGKTGCCIGKMVSWCRGRCSSHPRA